MVASLRPMTAAEIPEFVEWSRQTFIAERVTAGDDAAAAANETDAMAAEMFPNGEPSAGHALFRIEDDGEPVGSLWLGPASSEQPDSVWVWDIVIDEALRGRGLGRAAMLLAEQEARARGAGELGLTVFGHNPVARHLYESLGYAVVSMRMAKPL